MTPSTMASSVEESQKKTQDVCLVERWTPERTFSSFYNRGKPIYNEEHEVLFCLHDDYLYVVDYASSAILTQIGDLGESVTAFAVDPTGTTVITSCSSLLFRVYTLDWESFRRIRAQNIQSFGSDGLFITEKMVSEGIKDKNDLGSGKYLLPAHNIRSWKGPQALTRCLSISTIQEFPLFVAAGCVDGSLYVYDLNKGFCTHVFRKHATSIGVIKFHPRRLLLFSTSDDGEIRLHDLFRHISVARLMDHLSLPADLDFILSPNSADLSIGGLLSGSRDNIVNIWSLESIDDQLSNLVLVAAVRKKLLSQKDAVQLRAGLPPVELECNLTTKLVSDRTPAKKQRVQDNVDEDAALRRVHRWWLNQTINDDPLTLSPVHQIGTQESVAALLCVSSRSLVECRIETGSSKKPLKVSDVCSWTLVTAGSSGLLTLWNPQTRRKIATLSTPHTDGSSIEYLALHTSAKGVPWMVSAGSDHTITFWNLRSFSVERLLLGSGTELIHCQFLNVAKEHCASNLEISSDDKSETNVTKQKSLKPEVPFRRALLLRSDPHCVILEMSIGRTAASLLCGHTDIVLAVDSSPEGCWITTGSKDHTLRLWNARTESCIAVLEGHTAPVVGVQMSKAIKQRSSLSCTCLPDAEATTTGDFFVLSVCLEGVLKLWNLTRSVLRQRVQRIVTSKRAVTFFRDSDSDPVRLNCCLPGAESPLKITQSARSVNAHDKRINALAVAPNDKLAATGSSDSCIKVWTLPGLTLLGTCRGHTRPIWTLKFSPVEKVLASGSADHTIRLWSVKGFCCLKTFQGHQSSVLGLEFLTFGTQLISCGGDGLIKLWTIRTSECTATFDQHEGEKIWSLSVDSAGSHVMSASADHRLLLWKDTTDEAERLEALRHRQEAADILEIAALTRAGKTLEALTLAVKRRRAHQVRQLLEQSYEKGVFTVLDRDTEANTGTPTGLGQLLIQQTKGMPTEIAQAFSAAQLGDWIAALPEDQLKVLFEFVTKWNTNGQTSNLANTLLYLILRHTPSETLLRLEGFSSLASAFLAYTPRHTRRTTALLQRTYILDMILLTTGVKSFCEMPDLPPRGLVESVPTESLNPLSTEEAYTLLFD